MPETPPPPSLLLPPRFREERDIETVRPAGLPGYHLIHLLTPARVLSSAGFTVEQPGACLLYGPGQPQHYGGVDPDRPHDYRHVYFHMQGASVEGMLANAPLPVNAVFYPTPHDFIIPLIEEIFAERRAARRQWRQMVSLLVRRFLIELSRSVPPELLESAHDPLGAARRRRLERLRADIRDDLCGRWSVAEMARRAHMSPSRFHALYRERFGVSPIEDLIRARLERARWLLTNTAIPIARVAEESGFSSVYYFSQFFHRRVGCPPSQYYRRISRET